MITYLLTYNLDNVGRRRICVEKRLEVSSFECSELWRGSNAVSELFVLQIDSGKLFVVASDAQQEMRTVPLQGWLTVDCRYTVLRAVRFTGLSLFRSWHETLCSLL